MISRSNFFIKIFSPIAAAAAACCNHSYCPRFSISVAVVMAREREWPEELQLFLFDLLQSSLLMIKKSKQLHQINPPISFS
jgi:hypothetical protein